MPRAGCTFPLASMTERGIRQRNSAPYVPLRTSIDRRGPALALPSVAVVLGVDRVDAVGQPADVANVLVATH